MTNYKTLRALCDAATDGSMGVNSVKAHVLKNKSLEIIPALIDEIEKYREALEFYADEKRYSTPLYDENDLNNVGMPFPDKGHHAKQALKGTDNE